MSEYCICNCAFVILQTDRYEQATEVLCKEVGEK